MQLSFFFGIVIKLFLYRVSEFPFESLNADGWPLSVRMDTSLKQDQHR